ncbi:hypothetical protein C8R44DRAFT_982454 [Mycena epipterygia]|nr:hypothetical protein C8R44DRAFT_982454 [Mycena epipterygia]
MSLPAFSSSTTADKVFADEIHGKNVLITSMNGIGFETARVIAKYANLVVIMTTIRKDEAIKRDVPSANIRPLLPESLLALLSYASPPWK